MKATRWVVYGIAAIAAAGPTMEARADSGGRHDPSTNLVGAVREATRHFQDVSAAMAAGYASSGNCVSGPQEGAMGVHYPNGALVADGVLDATRPEILIYEARGGRLRLLGVEYLVFAQQWDAANPGPPVLMGQHFQYVGSPNRYRIPAFYELHVWAWRDNPRGMFADWNPAVSCEDYAGDGTAHASVHGTGQ